jgi:hypothetical protein
VINQILDSSTIFFRRVVSYGIGDVESAGTGLNAFSKDMAEEVFVRPTSIF